MIESIANAIVKYLEQRSVVERKIDKWREETERKADELKEEAIESAYAVKKALVRTIVEIIFLSTALLALVVGMVMYMRKFMPVEFIMIGYGVLVLIIVLINMKTGS